MMVVGSEGCAPEDGSGAQTWRRAVVLATVGGPIPAMDECRAAQYAAGSSPLPISPFCHQTRQGYTVNYGTTRDFLDGRKGRNGVRGGPAGNIELLAILLWDSLYTASDRSVLVHTYVRNARTYLELRWARSSEEVGREGIH